MFRSRHIVHLGISLAKAAANQIARIYSDVALTLTTVLF